MSSQLTNLVPVFDRQNYGQWSKAMKAFLMSQGLWGFTDGSVPHPGPGAPVDKVNAWQRLADMARGNIVLRLAPAIQQGVEDAATTQDVWHCLEVGYRSPSATTVYKDLKEAISTHIHPNTHPAPQIDKMSAAFACLYNCHRCTYFILIFLYFIRIYLVKYSCLSPYVTPQRGVLVRHVQRVSG